MVWVVAGHCYEGLQFVGNSRNRNDVNGEVNSNFTE